MTDAEVKKQIGRVKELCDPWVAVLGLGAWDITNTFDRVGLKTDAGDLNDNLRCMAKTAVRWPYLNANIMWNLPQLGDLEDDKLEQIVVHELCHILVHEMREWAPEIIEADRSAIGMKHEERVTTNLTNAFIWVRNAARRTKKQKSCQ